jgi:release factor glutamine methyltransferase
MPEVALHEPARALDGGADGLGAYRLIVADLPRLLRPEGRAVLELGQGQAPAVSALALGAGLEVLGTHADLGGVERALILRRP